MGTAIVPLALSFINAPCRCLNRDLMTKKRQSQTNGSAFFKHAYNYHCYFNGMRRWATNRTPSVISISLFGLFLGLLCSLLLFWGHSGLLLHCLNVIFSFAHGFVPIN